MTREIELSRGMVALVDDDDFDRVTALGRWYADRSCQTFYARRNFWTATGCKSVKMHAFITGWDYVDHVNGDGLDNRRHNLRRATGTQNAQNRRVRSDSRSGLKGVHARGSRWRAVIWTAGHRISLGSFASAEEAARAYDMAAIEHFGEFARLNFPERNAS